MSIGIRPTLAALFSLLLLCPRARPCSSCLLQDGDQLLFATNYDNELRPGLLFVNAAGVRKRGWEPGTTGEVATWTAKHGSITINVIGVELAWSGMNETGLVLSTMLLGETEATPVDERPGLASPLWMQYLLDTCATVEEVIAAQERVRITEARDHYLVADRTGACAVIEFVREGMLCHTGGELPVPALTNSLYAAGLERYEEGSEMAPDSYQSEARFARLAERIQSFAAAGPRTTVEQAFDALHDVSCAATRWSIVYDLRQRTMFFRTDGNESIRFIDLREIDFGTCEHRRMLDPHADLEGNLLDDFVAYSSSANRQLFRRAISHLRPGVAVEQYEPAIEILEGFSRASGAPEKP